MKESIEKFALQNAVKFEGKANPGAVIGQLFAEDPKLKSRAKELSREIAEVVKEVNSLSLDEQKERLRKLAPELLIKKKFKKKRGLPELKNLSHPFVTRIPPEPSKYLHIGHALSFLVNYMYAKKYDGKCVLRIDDTNPEKAGKEYYQNIYDSLLWLNVSPDSTFIASNNMDEFYNHAERLIEKGFAYVCFCDREKMSLFRNKSMICEHREQNPRQALEKWKEMFTNNVKPGDAVLRLAGEMDSLNAVMRDPVLFRISDHEHPLQKNKYRVWPMYDFESAVAEELCGVTYILRSSEFGTMRIQLQNHIKHLLGFKIQEVRQYGRFNVVGAVTKGREIRELIEKKEVSGWDDPRLVTLDALKRRGIVPETFYNLVIEAGLSPNQTNIDWSIIAAANRKIIDPSVKRFFFVQDQVKVKINNHLEKAEVPNHPDNAELGKRTISFGTEFYVQDDIVSSDIYRFMHLFNFTNKAYISRAYDSGIKAKIIHCVPVDGAIDVEVLMPDGKYVKGKGEPALADLEEGEIVQFERLFFCRLDDKKHMRFIYTHD